jgi:hypothetical protein
MPTAGAGLTNDSSSNAATSAASNIGLQDKAIATFHVSGSYDVLRRCLWQILGIRLRKRTTAGQPAAAYILETALFSIQAGTTKVTASSCKHDVYSAAAEV